MKTTTLATAPSALSSKSAGSLCAISAPIDGGPDGLVWVERLLSQWAAWMSGPAGQGGSLIMRYAPRSPSSTVPLNDATFDQRMLDVDRAIAGLMPALREVVVMEYLHGVQLHVRHRADRCRCNETTYRRRLRVAIEALADALSRR